MKSGVQEPDGAPEPSQGARVDEEYRAYATYFHTLRNAHNRVVLGIDVLVNKPMDEAEREQRMNKLQEAARQVTELMDQAPIPRAR
jgi:hypothetical protein